MSRGIALVTGASGALGPAVVAELQRTGYHVRTLSRGAGVKAADVDHRTGDVTSAGDVRAAMAGANVVVHLAALLHQFGPTSPDLDRAYDTVNAGGTATVVREALEAGVGRVVYLSTIAVYGAIGSGVADERTVPRPDTPYGRSKLAGETLVLGATRDGRPLGVVLRAAAVYGPRVKGNYRTLAEAIGRGRYVAIGGGGNRRTLVHEQDLARAVALSVGHPRAAGRVFNVSDGRIHRLADIVAAMHRAAGRREPRLSLPVWLASAAVRAGDVVTSLSGIRFPLSRKTLSKYLEDVAVDGSLVQRELGFVPQVTLDRGWREVMQAVLQQRAA